MSVYDQQATRKPPISQIGAILWLRTYLFSSWINTALTAASIYLLYIMIPPLLDWMFFNASFSFGTINFFGFDIKFSEAIQIVGVKALAGHISMKNSICIPMASTLEQRPGDPI